MRWYRDNLCAEEKKEAQKTGINAYEIIIKGATDKIVDLYVLPHFVGSGTPTLDAMSKGTILGLTIGTTKADISKALLDSGSYEMKLNLDQNACFEFGNKSIFVALFYPDKKLSRAAMSERNIRSFT